MKLIFSEQAWEDYLYWQKNDLKLLERVNTLIRAPGEIRGLSVSASGAAGENCR